jgi:hypothetical protein
MPLLIPGTCPEMEQELVDLNAGLDANSGGDHEGWLPPDLLNLIEVSFLLHFVLGSYIGVRTEHNIWEHLD